MPCDVIMGAEGTKAHSTLSPDPGINPSRKAVPCCGGMVLAPVSRSSTDCPITISVTHSSRPEPPWAEPS